MKRVAVAVALTATCLVSIPASADHGGTHTTVCPTEDGDHNQPRCAYDAKHQGNGKGKSFITDRNGNFIKHVPHWVAHRLLGG